MTAVFLLPGSPLPLPTPSRGQKLALSHGHTWALDGAWCELLNQSKKIGHLGLT